MKGSKQELEVLKWSIYKWIGAISVEEIEQNKDLVYLIEKLTKSMRFLNV